MIRVTPVVLQVPKVGGPTADMRQISGIGEEGGCWVGWSQQVKFSLSPQ